MSQMNIKQAAGFLIAGAIVGAGVALVCAPQSGLRARKDLGRYARKTVTRLDDLQCDIREQVTNWVDDFTEVVTNGVNRGKKLSPLGLEKVLLAFDSAKASVEVGKSRVEQLMRRENA